MKKILLIPFTLILMFAGTVAQAQFLGPLHEDTVGFIEFDFEGGAIADSGDLFGGVTISDITDADFEDIDPYGLYVWCLEVGLEYAYESTLGSDEGLYEGAFELGQATPYSVFEYLFTAPIPAGPPTAADVIDFYNGIPGFTDVSWPAPLGLAAEDVFFEILDDEDGLTILFGSEELHPDISGELYFAGSARLSLKSVGGTAVPEPSTYGMIGAGFLVVLVAFRRRKMSAQS